MKSVKALYAVVFPVIILLLTGCPNRYTCAEAWISCPRHEMGVTSIDIPWTLLDTSLPQSCYLSLTELKVKKITESSDPSLDMREMAREYYYSSTRAIDRNALIRQCGADLEEQREKNENTKIKFCKNNGMQYSPERGVCIPDD